MDYSLQEILDNVEQIREAIYGEEVRGSISNSIEMMAYETDTIQDFKDGVDKILEDYKNTYEQGFRDFADSVHRDMDKHVKDMDEKYDQFKTEVNRELNNHKVEMDNAFTEFKNSVHLTIANFTNDITAKMDTIQDEWIKYQQKTDLVIADFKMEMSNKYQEFTEKIISENSALKESVKTDIARMKNDIMNFEESVNQSLAKYQQELGENIETWNKTLTDKLSQNTQELEAIKKEIEDKLAEASQANPNLELVDAREGEPTLKDNLTKNYAKKEYVTEQIDKENTTKYNSVEVTDQPVETDSHEGVFRITKIKGNSIQDPETLDVEGVSSVLVKITGGENEEREILTNFEPCLHGLSEDKYDEYNAGTITRKIGVTTLNHESRWHTSSVLSENYVRFFHYWSYSGGAINSLCLNSFSSKRLTRAEYNSDTDAGWYTDMSFAVKIAKSDLETPDIEGFRKYLKEHPIKLYYELKEPKLESYKVEPALCYKNSTILVKSTPPTSAVVTYPITMGGRVALIETGVSDLRGVTQDLGGRTDKLEAYVNKHPNPVLTVNELEPDETGNIDITAGTEVKEVTYAELTKLIAESKLSTGGIYLLTDYKTKYEIPNTEFTREAGVEELYLTATSTNTLSSIAYSKQYPEDIIYYDITLDRTTSNKPRTGFITRRIDTKNNNATPFDFRGALWARFKLNPTSYEFDGQQIPYDTMEVGGSVEKGRIYKTGTTLWLAYKTGTPTNLGDREYLTMLLSDLNMYLESSAGIDIYENKTRLLGDTDQVVLLETFDPRSHDNYIEGFNKLVNCVFQNSSYNYIEGGSARLTFKDASFNTLGKVCVDINIRNGSNNQLIGIVSTCFINEESHRNIVDKFSVNVVISDKSSSNKLGKDSSNIRIFSHGVYIDLASECINTTFHYGCKNIRIGTSSRSNIFGYDCNNIELGSSCSNNVFGKSCAYIQFENSCSVNTLHDFCHNIKFENKCHNNQLFNYCQLVTLGKDSSINILEDDCINIKIGELCSRNTLKRGCNRVIMGAKCINNNLGTTVHGVTLASNCWDNTLGNNCGDLLFLGDVINCKFGDITQNLTIYQMRDKDITQNSELKGKPYNIIIQKSENGNYYYTSISQGGEFKLRPIP